MLQDIDRIKELFPYMTPEEKQEIKDLVSKSIWVPLQGPQTEAYFCQADELFYGGAAGGGKSDLVLGLALTQHKKSVIFRRQATQLQGILDRLHNEILKSRDGFNGMEKIQRLPGGRQIEFGSCSNIGDEQKYQGRPHDGLFFDEITHFLKIQYKFLCGWNRTTTQGQRCRIVATGNPPTDSDGEWVIEYWGPWLDPLHKNPAKPGELRWYAMIDGQDTEVDDGSVIKHGGETITPKSRTFISSRIQDNPYLMATGYMSQLQALPEPLRSQMLNGDFIAGIGDDPWQVLPTDWVRQAQERWTADPPEIMDTIGVDVARGGRDQTILSRRHGAWFDQLLAYPGAKTPDGPTVVGLIVNAMKNDCWVNIDVIGVGTSVYDHAKGMDLTAFAVNGAEKSTATDKTGKLKFRNIRAEVYWKLREALNPDGGLELSLPPDRELRADLCAPRWKLTPGGVLIEAKEDLIKRIGRSPDKGDAVALTFFEPDLLFPDI